MLLIGICIISTHKILIVINAMFYNYLFIKCSIFLMLKFIELKNKSPPFTKFSNSKRRIIIVKKTKETKV